MMSGVVVIMVISLVACVDAVPPNAAKVAAKIFDERLSKSDYNSHVRPGAEDGKPLDIYINIDVNDISYISEAQMEYSMTLYLRQIWKDERLAYTDADFNHSITLNYNRFDQIWVPDLYIENLKSGTFHTITVPNRLIRISPDGNIYYSQRLTVTLKCDMQLDRYPMDNQTCFIEFSSFSHEIDDLMFKWRLDAKPVEFNRAINLPEYTITDITNIACTQLTAAGTFPCLRAYFHLRRQLKVYLLNTYLPSFLVVLLSWLSFWIDPQSAPARTSLGIITILTITTQTSGLMTTIPSGSTTKAIDVWMATCLVFVFGAFIEYSAVNTLARRQKKTNAETIAHVTDGMNDVAESVDMRIFCASLGSSWSFFGYKENPALALEKGSRILFPCTFFAFCLVYWPFYLIR